MKASERRAQLEAMSPEELFREFWGDSYRFDVINMIIETELEDDEIENDEVVE